MLNIPTGISLITGVPGSGKSFWCVERVLDTVRKARRPVYTNLPLKWRVIKLWLKMKEGDDVAGLIRPITETTFNRFLDRFTARQKFLDERRHLGRRAARNLWYDTHGPDVIEGLDLNWIPAGSHLVIDEAHHWYPNPALANVRKREPETLMSYLTMHRHLMHRVFFVTQADRQVSSTIKSLLQDQIQIERIDADIPMLGLRFSEFGFVAFRIREWDGVADPEQEPPLREATIFPALPCNRYLFRVYSSFTHMGSIRELKKELASVQDQSITKLITESDLESPVSFKKRMFWVLSFVVAGCVTGMLLQSMTFSPTQPQQQQVAAGPTIPEIKVIGWADGSFITQTEDGTKQYRKGARLDDLQIMSVDRQNKLFISRSTTGDIYLWRDGVFNNMGASLAVASGMLDKLKTSSDQLAEQPTGASEESTPGTPTRTD